MARLLEVGYRMALMPSAGEGYRNEWASARRRRRLVRGLREEVRRDLPPARRRDLAVLRPREPLVGGVGDRDRTPERPRGPHRPHHRDVGRAEWRLPRAARDRAPPALHRSPAAALRLDQAAGGADARRGRGDAPAERRLRLPQHRLLPRAWRQHRAPPRREVLRAAADDGHGRRVDRHLPVDDAAARAVGLSRLPLVLRRRVLAPEDRPLPDPEPCLPALAAALPRPGRQPPGPARPCLRRSHPSQRAGPRDAGRARRGARSPTSSARGCTSSSPVSSSRTARSARTWPTSTCSGSSDAPDRPAQHPLSLRQADALRHPEPPADPGVERRAAGQRLVGQRRGRRLRRELRRRGRRRGVDDDGARPGRADRRRRRGHGRDQRYRGRAARPPRDHLATGLPPGDHGDDADAAAARAARRGARGGRRPRPARPFAPAVGSRRRMPSPTSRARPARRPPPPRR